MPVEVSTEQQLREEALTLTQKATLITIVDQETYDIAASTLLDVKTFRSRWKEYWNPVRDSAYKAYTSILDKINERDKPAEAVERMLKSKIGQWDIEQERIRQEQQRKAQEEFERQQAEERLAEAVMAEQAGVPQEQVEAILTAPVTVVAPVIAPTYEKASGISRRENWKARVVDMKALCKAIGAGKVPVEYVCANDSALNARAKADKQTLNIPGVQAYNEPIISGRTR
jgi:hypothetical protein